MVDMHSSFAVELSIERATLWSTQTVSVLGLNILGGALILVGTAVLMYGSYRSDREGKEFARQVQEITQPEAVAGAVSNVRVSEFMKAIRSGVPLDVHFPEIYNHVIDDEYYPEILSFYFNLRSSEFSEISKVELTKQVGVLIANSFPEKAAAENRFRKDASFLRKEPPRPSEQFDEELLVALLSSAMNNPTNKDLSTARSFVSMGYHGDAIEVIHRRFPNRRTETRTWLEKSGKEMNVDTAGMLERFDELEDNETAVN